MYRGRRALSAARLSLRKLQSMAISQNQIYPAILRHDVKQYIQTANPRLLIIMRGIPGSGKSYLVNQLTEFYPQSVVCSADLFRYDSNGCYVWKKEKLQESHALCQGKARNACQKNEPIIIIDNTNIQSFEYQTYLDMANQYDYLVLMITPRTSWSDDAFQLEQRCVHRVPLDVIQNKLKIFRTAMPRYVGWFLDPETERKINLMAWDLVDNLFTECNEMKRAFFNNGYVSSPRNHWTKQPSNRLHVTVKFFPYASKPNEQENQQIWINQPLIQDSMGDVFYLNLIGLVITKSCIFVRVKLPDHKDNKTRRIWESNMDNISYDSKQTKAHITIAHHKSCTPKKAGEDLVDIIQYEINNRGACLQPIRRLPLGELYDYQNQRYYFLYRKPMDVLALFMGFYS